MFVAILLMKDSKRDFLENNKGEVTRPEGIESSSVCSAQALKEGSSGALIDGTVMVVVDGTDRAASVFFFFSFSILCLTSIFNIYNIRNLAIVI